MGDGPVPLTATLFGYFGVCPREAWLMGHALEPFPEHELLALGRLLQERSYSQGRKEVALPGMRLDLLGRGGKTLVVAEVKRSSGEREAHLLQLGYYLLRLREMGLECPRRTPLPRGEAGGAGGPHPRAGSPGAGDGRGPAGAPGTARTPTPEEDSRLLRVRLF